MYLMRNHDVWIYVRCANSDPRIAFDRLYDLIDEAAGHGFLVRGTSFDHCSGNTLKDRIGLRTMLDAVENGQIEAVMVRDLEQSAATATYWWALLKFCVRMMSISSPPNVT